MDDLEMIPSAFEDENTNHNPSRNPANLRPRPGILLLQRPAQPSQDESRGGLAIPTKGKRDTGKTRAGQVDVDYPPNCARVFAAGEGCKAKVGDYVFFYQRVEEPQEAYHRKPQPLIPFYDPFDRFPALWVMHDKYVLADIKHAGDAVGFEVTGNVEVLNLLGNWRVLSCEDIRIGERFRTFDGGGEVSGVFVALGDAKLVSEDRVMVTAAPYDGSES